VRRRSSQYCEITLEGKRSSPLPFLSHKPFYSLIAYHLCYIYPLKRIISCCTLWSSFAANSMGLCRKLYLNKQYSRCEIMPQVWSTSVYASENPSTSNSHPMAYKLPLDQLSLSMWCGTQPRTSRDLLRSHHTPFIPDILFETSFYPQLKPSNHYNSILITLLTLAHYTLYTPTSLSNDDFLFIFDPP
jgi:hypothetical protein